MSFYSSSFPSYTALQSALFVLCARKLLQHLQSSSPTTCISFQTWVLYGLVTSEGKKGSFFFGFSQSLFFGFSQSLKSQLYTEATMRSWSRRELQELENKRINWHMDSPYMQLVVHINLHCCVPFVNCDCSLFSSWNVGFFSFLIFRWFE